MNGLLMISLEYMSASHLLLLLLVWRSDRVKPVRILGLSSVVLLHVLVLNERLRLRFVIGWVKGYGLLCLSGIQRQHIGEMASQQEAWEPRHHGGTLIASRVEGKAPFVAMAKLLLELIATPDCPAKHPGLVQDQHIEQVCPEKGFSPGPLIPFIFILAHIVEIHCCDSYESDLRNVKPPEGERNDKLYDEQ